ncbi:MAG: BlaI/MecI/CopY family transcriptional regulator [Planctomycetota bacterium]
MARTPPSDVELQVLTVLWEKGPSSVHDVREAMPDGKARAYTTVLSIMQNLERKGLVRHTQQGPANIYHPIVNRNQVLRPMMKGMLTHFFGGRPSQVLQCLLESTDVDAKELEQIKKILATEAKKRAEGEKK